MRFDWLSNITQRPTKTVGSVIDVSLPELGIDSIGAKVDTGAFSGSLHAQNIRVVKAQNGKRQLEFTPHGSKLDKVTITKFHRRSIKSSNGQTADRYAFNTTIIILGQSYPIVISLSNRSSMKYQMLIGRKFLKTNGFLVDVSLINQ